MVNLVEIYHRASRASEYNESDLRVAWKIASDPHYWAAFKIYKSLQAIYDGGFFDDGLEPGTLTSLMDPHWMTTPVDKILKEIDRLSQDGTLKDKPLSVLLTTGCFAPVHEGHIMMMEKARARVEDAGYRVLGGYISPSHDHYVATKGEKARRLSASLRLTLLNRILDKNPWLMCDPWESRYAPTDLNFTDVIQRLRVYLRAHVKTSAPIEVAYVFGADNIQFGRAFTGSGLSVCVGRPGKTIGFDILSQDPALFGNPRIMYAGNTEEDIASSQIRDGQKPVRPEIAQDEDYQKLLDGTPRFGYFGPEDIATYLVRDDLDFATLPWKGIVPEDILERAVQNFRDGLKRAIEGAFDRSRLHSYPRAVDVKFLDTQLQQTIADRVCAEAPTINIDMVTNQNGHSFGVSRLFHQSAPQLRPDRLVRRPGSEELLEYCAGLKPGVYTFMDDDIATGTTMGLLEGALPEGVRFGRRVSLAEEAFKIQYPGQTYAFWDIVDSRDFLMGSRSSGVVTRLFNNEVARAPYLLPYASPVFRAKIPPDQEMSFSRDILTLNQRFFRDIWVDLKLSQTDPEFQGLMKQAGFNAQTTMSTICSYHDQRMRLV